MITQSQIDREFGGAIHSSQIGGEREEDKGVNPLFEVGKSVAWGGVEAVRSISNMFLPDWENPIKGPTTFYGQFIGTATQFFLPYGALTGTLAAAGKIHAVTHLGKGGKFIKWLDGTETSSIARAALARSSGEGSISVTTKLAVAAAGQTGRATVKGGLVDFAAFEGKADRLSDVIQSNPALANPITEFLSNDEEDSEAFARLKNVLEGAALGFAFDSVVDTLRGVRAQKKALAAGATPEEAGDAAIRALDDSVQSRKAQEEATFDTQVRVEADQVLLETTLEDGTVVSKTGADLDKAAQQALDELRGIRASQVPKKPKQAKGKPGKVQDLNVINAPREFDEVRAIDGDEAMTSGSVDPMDEDSLTGIAEEIFNDSGYGPQNTKPRDMSELERAHQGLDKKSVNLKYLFENEAFMSRLVRGIHRFNVSDAEAARQMRHVKDTDILATAFKDVKRLNSLTAEQVNEVVVSMQGNIRDIYVAGRKAMMFRTLGSAMARNIVPELEKISSGAAADVTVEAATKLAQQVKMFTKVTDGSFGVFSATGSVLRQAAIPISESDLMAKFGESFTFKPLEALLALEPNSFEPEKVQGLLQQLRDVMHSQDPVANMRAMEEFLQAPMMRQVVMMAQEYHINALLSGISTQVVNFTSGLAMSFWRPIEQLIGGSLGNISATAATARRTAKQTDLQQSLGVLKKQQAENAAKKVQDPKLDQRIETVTKELEEQNELVNAATIDRDQMRKVVRQAEFQALGIMDEFKESWGIMRQSGTDPFDSAGKMREATGRFSAIKAFGQDKGLESLFSPMSRLINLPGNALEKGDRLMKIANGRARFKAVLKEDMLRKQMDPAFVDEKVEETLSIIMRQKGDIRTQIEVIKAIRKQEISDGLSMDVVPEAGELMSLSDEQLDLMMDAHDQGLIEGMQATWTHDMRDDGAFGKVAAGVQMVAQRMPTLKFFLPFIRTPTNIADFGWDKSVGAVIGLMAEGTRTIATTLGVDMPRTNNSYFRMSRMLADPDPAVRATARTNMVFGLGMVGAILAETTMIRGDDDLPTITGSGPSNPDAQKALRAAGWQPFSIKVGGKYLSYSRLDPLASYMGILVDSAEYIKEHAEDEGGSIFQTVTLGTAIAVANNLTSKTYAQGVANIIDLLSDPDRNGERVLGSMMGSFVPTIVSDTEKVLDPEMQEIRAALDRAVARTPGLSSSMPVRRDLLGQPIVTENPFASAIVPIRVTKVKDSVVERELARFAYGFQEPSTTRGGIDLLDERFFVQGQPAYDRMVQMVGTVKRRGMDVRQALRKEIASSHYQRIDPEETPDGERSPRIDRINAVLREYRNEAWKQLNKEIPGLRSAVREAEEQTSRRRRGLTL